MSPRIRKAVIVYQVGIANVFAVDRLKSRHAAGRNARRIMQHAYEPCTNFARGLAAAGVVVRTAHCDQAGDIARADWTPGKGDLWRDHKATVHAN